MTFDRFLALLKSPKKAGDGYVARCPAHDDREASLSVARGADGRILVNCFAGCSAASVVDALGLTYDDLFDDDRTKEKELPPTSEKTIYTYHDATGTPVIETHRYDTAEGKHFYQYHVGPDGERHSGLPKDIERPLYQLPLLLKACREGRTVFHVEGEKCADMLLSFGLTATTSLAGSKSWRDSYGDSFRGAYAVVVLPDNDDPGRVYAEKVKASIEKRGICCVVLDLPGLPAKGDVVDYLTGGGSAEALVEMAKARLREKVAGVKLFSASDLADAYEHYEREGLDPRAINLQTAITLKMPYWILPGELVVLLGAEKRGKTALVQNLALALRGEKGEAVRTLWVDTEGVGESLLFRRGLQIAHGLIRDPDDPKRVVGYKPGMANVLTHVTFISEPLSLEALRLVIRQTKPRLVVVDTPDGLEAKGYSSGDITRKMSYLVPELKHLAKQEEVVILAVSHVSRMASQSGVVTANSGLGSGAYEKKADKVLVLNGDVDKPFRTLESGRARDEEPFTVHFHYEPLTFRFRQIGADEIPLYTP